MAVWERGFGGSGAGFCAIAEELSFVFSPPAVDYTPIADGATVTGQAKLTAGGQGQRPKLKQAIDRIWQRIVDKCR